MIDALAQAAGIAPPNLRRALRPGSDARPPTVRAVLRVLGLEVPEEEEVEEEEVEEEEEEEEEVEAEEE